MTMAKGERYAMSQTIKAELGGLQFDVEVEGSRDESLQAAGGLALPKGAAASFDRGVEILGAIAAKFGEVFEGRKIGAAEITLGLKLTAKGDFVVVGSSGEATLTLKLTLPAS